MNKSWFRGVSLGLAALLLLSGCDDDEEKNPEVEVHVPKGVEVKVKRIEDDEMVVVAELLAVVGVVLWALFGPGAGRRWSDVVPSKGTSPSMTTSLGDPPSIKESGTSENG